MIGAQLDARPTMGALRVLLFALGLLFAGLASYVVPWITAFAFLMLGWRAWAESRNLRMPSRLVKSVLALFALVLVLASYRTLNGAEAGSALLMVMIALKLTEVRRIRDAVFVIVLAYFLLFAGILYSQEIPFVIWMLPAGWALTAALLVVTRNPPEPAFLTAMRRSGRFLLQALPFAAILFVLFPRIPGPLWGVPSAGGAGVSGLDDTMTPGSISQLVQSDEVAFRVRFHGDAPPPGERYWRGPTLHLFDGRTWMQGIVPFVDVDRGQAIDEPVRYTVMLEPHQRHWLYTLTLPTAYPSDAVLTRDFLLASRRPVTQRRSYEVTSHLEHIISRELTDLEHRWALQLPDRFNPRTRELAEQWRRETDGDWAIVQRALAMIREQEFYYTLEAPPLRSHSVDDFLFRTRAGFCEHYASAFVFLMRAAGVPARVVTGYLGGERNAFSDYHVVRQSDAHAWSEVWLPQRGWVRVDPTSAVAPNRIERGLSGSLSGENVPDHLRGDADSFLLELEMRWEALNGAWNEFFLGFGPEQQRQLLEQLGMLDPSWEKMVFAMTLLIGTGGILLWAWLLWTHRPLPQDPPLRLFRKLQRLLVPRLGRPNYHEGPHDFASRVAREAPDLAPLVREFVDEYIALRYLPIVPDAHRLRHLRQLLKTIRSQARLSSGDSTTVANSR